MRESTSGPLLVWARSEIRQRWASLVLLGVLAGGAAGLTIAALDGIQRSNTSYQRMRSELGAADVVFFPSQVGYFDIDITRLDEIPEVAAWGGFSLNLSQLEGYPPGAAPLITSGAWFDTLERAKVLEGRLPDPTREDEVIVTEPVLDDVDIEVGDVVPWHNLSAEQTLQAFDGALPPDFDTVRDAAGPTTNLRIVGVLRLPIESVASFATDGLVLTSPAWAAAHLGETLPFFTNAVVRLRNGAADVPAFTAAVARVYGRSDLPVKDLALDIKRVEGSLDLERTALGLFAIAVAVAAVVLVGQSMARSARAAAESVPVLSAMGLPGPALIVGTVIPFALTTVVALLAAAVAEIVLSARFPIGFSRQLDPSLGVHVNGGLLVVGLAVTLALAVAGAFLTAALAVRAQTRRGRRFPRTRTLGAATRAGLSVPSAVGLSLAVEQGRRRGNAVRPALVAATIGVVGVVGATTIVQGIDDAAAHRERTGAVWDAELTPVDIVPFVPPEPMERLRTDDDVAALSVVSRFAVALQGLDAPIYAVEPVKGALEFVVLSGEAPRRPGEVALGPSTADHLGVGIGDMVTISNVPLRVTGTALLMQTPHSAYDEGAWLAPSDLETIVGDHPDQYSKGALLRLEDGADLTTVMATVPELTAAPPSTVADVVNLSKVRRLPFALAGFLVALAVGAVAHTLLVGSRRRAHELAVLRAVGLTPRQTAACVGWQATVIGVVALAIGLPTGSIVGRQVWRLITDSLSFVYRAPFARTVIVVAIPVVVATLAILAAWPARAAARLRTAQVLRSE